MNSKHYINQNYFKYWSHNMAYVLGLWFANGSVKHGYDCSLTMPSKDKYMLKYIKNNELEYNGNIGDCKIQFESIEIHRDLTDLKSNFPDLVPEKFLPDFIRGYFDGKGEIKQLKNNRINSAFTCESKNFLNGLLKILKEKAGVEGGSYDKTCLSLKFGKRDSLKIGKYIYQNNPELFLLRKRKKFGNDICV